MIDGLIAFYHSGFDAKVYCMCIVGWTAIAIVRLRRSTGYDDFISRLAREIALLTMQAGVGLLLVVFIRYIRDCHASPDCSIMQTIGVVVTLTITLAISFAPFVYLWMLRRPLPRRTPEEGKPVILLPSPETFTDRGDDR